MKAYRVPILLFLCSLGITLLALAQGPLNPGSETVARPRKGNASTSAPEPKEEKIPSKFGKKGDLPADVPTFKSDVVTVSLDVAVLDNKGNFIPNIPKGNFRVLEDNVPQQVSTFSRGEAPMTICLVIEFSGRFQQYYTEPWYQTLTAAYGFLQTLHPEDYVAIIAYDIRPEILSDFSTNRQESYEAMRRLTFPGFSEANLFDALVDTAQRMQDVEGRKAIVVMSSGVDTFSKLNYDKTRRALQDAGVPIYAIGLMQTMREFADAAGGMDGTSRIEFLQADNQMRTFAKETGGLSFFPRFYGEFPSIFRSISEAMRNEYVLTYNPTNQAKDGKVRKIKVDLVNPATNEPLRVVDEKGKPIKYQILTKSGYTAPHEVE